MDGDAHFAFAVVMQPQAGVNQSDVSSGFFDRDHSSINLFDVLVKALQHFIRKTGSVVPDG